MLDCEVGEIWDVMVFYWMNWFQNLDCWKFVFVIFNFFMVLDLDKIFVKYVYDYFQFDVKVFVVKCKLDDIQGVNNIWFCGVWFGYGFYEDGFVLGFKVVKVFGVVLLWEWG